MRFFLTIVIVVQSAFSYSQKDTLFLYHDGYMIGNQRFNETIDGKREGKWIEYGLTEIRSIALLVDLNDTIEKMTGYTHWINFNYKPLKKEEENKKIDFDLVFNDTTIVLNWIPPDDYYISSRGKYKNGLKDGQWLSYYRNGQVKKKIFFRKDKPIKKFFIYQENGDVMFIISPKGKDIFKVCRYFGSESTPECSDKSYNEINILLN